MEVTLFLQSRFLGSLVTYVYKIKKNAIAGCLGYYSILRSDNSMMYARTVVSNFKKVIIRVGRCSTFTNRWDKVSSVRKRRDFGAGVFRRYRTVLN